MPTILTIDVSTAGLATRILDDFATINNYTGFDNNNVAETKQQFLKRIIMFRLKETVKLAEANAAANSARATAEATAESQIILT